MEHLWTNGEGCQLDIEGNLKHFRSTWEKLESIGMMKAFTDSGLEKPTYDESKEIDKDWQSVEDRQREQYEQMDESSCKYSLKVLVQK